MKVALFIPCITEHLLPETGISMVKVLEHFGVEVEYVENQTCCGQPAYNAGYHDKGIGISIPLRLFKGTDSRTSFKYLLSPWTRDTGQDIDHFSTLFDFIGRNTTIFLDKDKEFMYK